MSDEHHDTPDEPSNVIDFKAIQPAAGYDKLEEWAAEAARLAALPELEYERVRKDEAKRLNVRVSALDKAVKQARPKDEADGRAGRRIELHEVEPWPDPVDGAELLDALLVQLKRFLIADEMQLIATALWILHTHAFGAWWISPKLLVKSATKRCGKTRVFESIERLVARRMLISASTSSAVFRLIAAHADAPPTLLMDEADNLTQRDDDMRKLINAGQTKTTAHVMISVPCGDGWEPREFSTWAPIALAGIGDQADTIRDRAVTVKMKRKTKMQRVEKLRGNKDYGFLELARKCARWGADHVEALKDAEPAMPELLHDRAQDNWEPLIVIADAAGGEWPKRARAAAVAVQREVEEFDAEEVGVQLLHDIGDVFEGLRAAPPSDANVRGFLINSREWCEASHTSRVTTAYLLARLHGLDERFWSTYGKGGTPLKAHELADLLRQFEVSSRQLKFHIDGKEYNWRGYEQPQFLYLLAQYPKNAATPLPSAETAAVSAFEPPESTPPKSGKTRRNSQT
jgi:putative DNA primase/helicase